VWIVLAREQADDPALIAKIRISSDSARLRLTLAGQTVVGWFQPVESGPWKKIGECALVNKDTVHLGVFTHGGLADAERWVTLRNFHIYKSSE